MTSSPVLRTPITEDLLAGAVDVEHTDRGLLLHRLPSWTRAQWFDGQGPGAQLAMAEAQPAGVRLAFRTAATVVELDAVRTTVAYVGVPARPDGSYDLLVDGRPFAAATSTGGDRIHVDMTTGEADVETGPAGTMTFTGLPDSTKDVEIWLPYNERIELVELRTDAPVEPAHRDGRVWVHHGSSISQGSNAAGPADTWAATAARAAGVELVNLGFSGSMMLDPFVARTLRDAAADVLSLEVGINLVNSDAMRVRTFTPALHGFLDTVRDGHPDTPLTLVSPLYCPIHEDTPGPGAFDVEALREGVVRFAAAGDPADVRAGKLTLRVIRDQLRDLVDRRADPNLFLVDGLDLYGESDHAEFPLPDALHPGAESHRIIGQRFADRVLSGR